MPLPLLRPCVGERVELTVIETGTELLAVVDDVTPTGAIILREPVELTGAPTADLPEGTRLVVGWLSPQGRHDLDVVLDGFSHDRMTLWHLVGPERPRTTQLRRYVRASDALRVRVVRGPDQWSAVVADLSEGGARCVVVNTRAIRASDHVVVHMTVEASDLGLPAHVLEVSPLPEGRSQLRLEFLDIGRDADVVRRHVLDQQRRSRATA